MRVLFLDDQEVRFTVFKQLCIGKGVQAEWVDTADKAIDFLRQNDPYDLVCLDHDLGPEHYNAYSQEEIGEEPNYGDDATGYDVALFIVTELDDEKQPRFAAVHSFNRHGSQRMTAVLSEAGAQEVIFVFPFSEHGYAKTIDEINTRLSHGN